MKIFNTTLVDEPNVAVQIKDLKLLSEYNIIDKKEVAQAIIHNIINSVNAPDDYVYVVFKNQDVVNFFYNENCIIDYNSISKKSSEDIDTQISNLQKENLSIDMRMLNLGNENWRKGLLIDSQINSNKLQDIIKYMNERNKTEKPTDKKKVLQRSVGGFQQAG